MLASAAQALPRPLAAARAADPSSKRSQWMRRGRSERYGIFPPRRLDDRGLPSRPASRSERLVRSTPDGARAVADQARRGPSPAAGIARARSSARPRSRTPRGSTASPHSGRRARATARRPGRISLRRPAFVDRSRTASGAERADARAADGASTGCRSRRRISRCSRRSTSRRARRSCSIDISALDDLVRRRSDHARRSASRWRFGGADPHSLPEGCSPRRHLWR